MPDITTKDEAAATDSIGLLSGAPSSAPMCTTVAGFPAYEVSNQGRVRRRSWAGEHDRRRIPAPRAGRSRR